MRNLLTVASSRGARFNLMSMSLVLGCVAALMAMSVTAWAAPPAGKVVPHIRMHLLDPAFDPNSPQGGVPFCSSGSLGTVLCYPPSFLKAAYHFPKKLDGTGQTIVIVDAFGSPTLQSDFNTFNTTFGLPATNIQVLCGPTWTGASTDNCPVKTIADLSNAPNAALCGATGWAEETTLDVTQAHALAPGAKIVVVVANDCMDSSINAAEAAVVGRRELKGSIMSQSFGEPDDQVDPTIRSVADSGYVKANQNRWTIIASTGDWGANEDIIGVGTTELTPSWPSTNPLIIAAGGTEGYPYGGDFGPPPGAGGVFTCPANTNCSTGLVVINGGPYGCQTSARPGVPSSCIPVGYGGEQAWNEADVLGVGTTTGGGVSAFYAKPFFQSDVPSSYQTLLGSTVKAKGRMNPDVSFNAAVNGGVLAYLGFLGRWAVFGGTSAASPAWAGIMALANQANGGPLGFVSADIYDLQQESFHDITVGDNSVTEGQFGIDGFLSQHGYDLTTGWGTPDVSSFINAVVQNQQ